VARQVERVPKGVGRIASLRDGREIKDGKRGHEGRVGAPSTFSTNRLKLFKQGRDRLVVRIDRPAHGTPAQQAYEPPQ
jgi:hypothetical protein